MLCTKSLSLSPHLSLRPLWLSSLSVHQPYSSPKPGTQEAWSSSAKNWSASISLLFHLLFGWKCFPLAFFRHLLRDRDIGAGGSEPRGLLSHWWLSSHPSICSPFSSPCPLWRAGGIPPLGFAGCLRTLAERFQGKYRELSSVLEASELSLSAWLWLSIAVISKAENLPELVTFPIDSATLAV